MEQAPSIPRIPSIVNGIQVNFCKNPNCLNYGRPASEASQPRGKKSINGYSRETDTYKLSGNRDGRIALYCKLCGESPTLKSNQGISEELDRLTRYWAPVSEPSCPTAICDNHSISISTPKAYYSFGKTKSGSQRYRCRLCNATFAVGGPTNRQKRPELNEMIFRLLVNKMPFKRICETVELGSMNALYWKIDFIHQRCLAFAASQERRLPEMEIPRLYLSVDRQDHLVNWNKADDKRNIVLNALGTADNRSGYVFGIHINYDESLDAAAINAEASVTGDILLKQPFRRYARLWLEPDYSASMVRAKKATDGDGKALRTAIDDIYAAAVQREDIEDPEMQSITTKLPGYGMQVHAEYTLYAHFIFLRKLLGKVEKLRFYMDQESGIRAACLSAFWQEILDKRCDAFYVRIKKDLTINQKRKLKADAQKQITELRESLPYLEDVSDDALRLIVIKERMQELVKIGKWNDKWLFYPFPDMSEPMKAICWLTDLHDRVYDDDHLARLYSKGTLHGIDRFFMQVRRRLSLLERPITSASGEGRKWYGYSPYNPIIVGKLLDIFRVFYNFAEIGDDKRTPAMRLRLVGEPITLSQILA